MTIITGGSKGIGEGCARVFVDAGARVVISARGADAGERLADELGRKGPGRHEFVQGDVARNDDLRRLVVQTVQRHGRIDCRINNAGYHPPFSFIDDFTEEQFLDVLQTNLVG